MIYSIDHQTWPTTHTHNGKTHVVDETPPIRLQSINGSEDDVVKLPEGNIEVWKAKHLVGREWEEDGEDGKGEQPAVEAESQHPRSRSTRSRSPDFAESSKGDSENQAKRRKADAVNGTTHDKVGWSIITTRNSEGEGGVSSPDKASSTITPTRGPIPGVPVDSSILVPPQLPAQLVPRAQNHGTSIRVVSTDGTETSFNVNPRVRGANLFRAVIDRMGFGDEETPKTVRALVDGHRWLPEQSAADVGLWDDKIPIRNRYVEFLIGQCGGKPVIYLYPPQSMLVDVALSLCPQCESFAHFPLQ